ncbi:MAG: outer membrane beta-barrel protein [Betaproteobacteria bacterium]|nr:outer membrane beta-barrel protein [Betaproteobacteria bacterium]
MAILAAGVLVPVTDAVALWDDRLELFVAQMVTRDDNVFRLSAARDPAAVLGTSSKGDTYHTTSLGFNLDVPVSRQRVQAGWVWNNTRYNRYTALSSDGHYGRAAWLWQIGSDLGGQLGYTEALALASLANAQGGVQSSTANFLTTRRAFFNAEYGLTSRWRYGGEVSRIRQTSSFPAFRVNDVSIDGADLTASYSTRANNRVGIRLGVEEGRFPNRQAVAGNFFDNAYRQRRAVVVADWTITGASHASVRAGWVSRSHEQLAQRDFEDATVHAAYDWKPTGKLSLSAVAQRDVSPLDDLYSRSVLVTGIALHPELRLTEKTVIRGALEYSQRDYLSDPALALGAAPNRSDRVRSAAVMVFYRPVRPVTLQIALQRETRSSTVAFGDYMFNIVNVSARIGF